MADGAWKNEIVIEIDTGADKFLLDLKSGMTRSKILIKVSGALSMTAILVNTLLRLT